MKTIHITTGDPDGIGLEVSIKALNKIGPGKKVQFVLWRSVTANKETINLIDSSFNRIRLKGTKLLEKYIKKKENSLVDMALPPTPTQWVAKATQYCLKHKENNALVTGPLSKTQMQKEGFNERGHTDLLKQLSQTEHIFMSFLGSYFNVVLLTGHVPIKGINWNNEKLNKCIELCLKLKNKLPLSQQKKKIGLLGFNPHAGEQGLLGDEEFLLKQVIKKWKDKVEGPLAPDVAFFRENWRIFSIYICLYHDQALIPFKMIHERKSLQLSLGLPFIRTSVSHGTAKDLFGKNNADMESMKQALLWTIRFL